jgi:predicted nucleotidyltransferase
MRLNVEQIQDIVGQAHAIAGREATVWLFGSRLDDRRSGGDVDLLIESTPSMGLMQRAQLKMALEGRLQLPVDIIAADPSTPHSAFVKLARAQATRLCGAPT